MQGMSGNFGGLEGRLASGPLDPSAFCFARPRHALPARHAWRRRDPLVVCSSFGLDRYSSFSTRSFTLPSFFKFSQRGLFDTTAFSSDDGVQAGENYTDLLKHLEQSDASSNEWEILEERVAAAAAIAAADDLPRFFRARRTSAAASSASARSAISASKDAVRTF